MNLTDTERMVIERLQHDRVTTMKTLRDELDVCHMTIVRACKKYGYFTSINRNAAFYTLHDCPRFDRDGLWFYQGICFSQHRTLEKTLVALVENASAGLTVLEVEERLRMRVGNLLSRLCGRRTVSRCSAGRHAVYLAADNLRQQQQRDARERQERESPGQAAQVQIQQPTFPPNCDVILVLEVLIHIIKLPQADAGVIARALRAHGHKITSTQVQRVFDFYSLKKKRYSGDRGTGLGTGSWPDG
jgi:hypothetical protein